jgi:hypothetical protein
LEVKRPDIESPSGQVDPSRRGAFNHAIKLMPTTQPAVFEFLYGENRLMRLYHNF